MWLECVWLLDCLTAAFGRRRSFLIPTNGFGPWSYTEGSAGLYVVEVCVVVGLSHSGLRLSCLIPPRGWVLGLVTGPFGTSSVGFPHSGLRPPALFFKYPPRDGSSAL